MDSHAVQEIGFWRGLYQEKGHEGFLEQRKADWDDMAKNLPELEEFLKNGSGDEKKPFKVLEVGTGLISPLEFAEKKAVVVHAIDPLMDKYQDTIDLNGRSVRYEKQSGEAIAWPDESFDAVVCLNVIDHTPDPALMIQEIRRVLKPGGKFFFQVNFDPALSPAHYAIWNDKMVETVLAWKAEIHRTDYREEHHQTRFWAVYVK